MKFFKIVRKEECTLSIPFEAVHMSYSCSPSTPKGRILLCSVFVFTVVKDLFKQVNKYEMTQ